VNAASVAPAITAQPQNQTVTVGSTATFSVTATGTAPLSFQWQKNQADIAGATSSNYTTPATVIGDNGSTFQVVVSNGILPNATSTAATLAVNAVQQVTAQVLTYHNDTLRTGLNPNETILTTSNVNSTSFGKLGTLPVTGLVDAEPLYVPNLTINGAAHNVVFVVTEHDLAYAFDADTPGNALWENTTLLPSGEASSDDRGCGQVQPEIGITSTPVIDLGAGPNGTMFLVTMSKDSGGKYHHRLHALDLTTGAERLTAQEVAATYPGTGTGSSGGTQTFNAASYEERSALLLSNGTIYTTWTSHCDAPNYTSWLISFSESNLQRSGVLNMTANGTTQNGQEGGIWAAGSGPSIDASGNVYFLVGNGTFDTTLNGSGFPQNADYGNSFMKISTTGGTLAVADYFAMNNGSGTAESESSADTDLGSGGAMLLPDLQDGQGNTLHLGAGAGKDGNLYVVNRDGMGKFAPNDANIYQELGGALSGGIWSAPAYFNGAIYYGPNGGKLRMFQITNAKLGTAPSSTSPATFGYPGTTPSITSNGNSNGIVWALQSASSIGVLHAYDATNLATELYNSNQAANGRDQYSTNSNDKFITPMIANGKVYVETPGAVVVFGLLP
jgi:hypothetical protein